MLSFYFQITAETTGWVGLGISPNGGMTGADIIMAWVANDGTTNILVSEILLMKYLFIDMQRLCCQHISQQVLQKHLVLSQKPSRLFNQKISLRYTYYELCMQFVHIVLQDMYATANQAPVKDESQDVTFISATETNGATKVTFKRKINTCDKDKDNILEVSFI